jgi:hypothetical protein
MSISEKVETNSHSSLSNFIDTDSFNPIVGKPYNIDKVTLSQIDNLNITYIFTTGRSASTLLGVMLMMHEEVIFTSEEVFPVVLQQKYKSVKHWTEQTIKEYCEDFVIMSEGKLYPLFTGKDVLYNLLMQFKEHLNFERVIRISYLAFGVNKDLSKITTIIDKQLRYYLSENYLKLFPDAKVLLLIRDPRDNVYSKYNRAKRREINPQPCIYIQTWKIAFSTYFKLLKKYQNKFLIVNYEKLINESKEMMMKISDFLSLTYTENYFKYPELTKLFFDSIKHPKLKEHFNITHKSLTMPISPQKVNEWMKEMNNPEIAHLINTTWTSTKEIAIQSNYQTHPEYKVEKIYCIKSYLKTQTSFVSSFIYFHYLPFKIKKFIKIKKYPQRQNAVTSFDRFLRQSYL